VFDEFAVSSGGEGGGARFIQSKIDECLTPREFRQAGSSILVNITFTTVVMKGNRARTASGIGTASRLPTQVIAL
jgi:hypothetical protein